MVGAWWCFLDVCCVLCLLEHPVQVAICFCKALPLIQVSHWFKSLGFCPYIVMKTKKSCYGLGRCPFRTLWWDGSICAERVKGRRFESRANVKSAKKSLTLAQPPLFELWLHLAQIDSACQRFWSTETCACITVRITPSFCPMLISIH